MRFGITQSGESPLGLIPSFPISIKHLSPTCCELPDLCDQESGPVPRGVKLPFPSNSRMLFRLAGLLS